MSTQKPIADRDPVKPIFAAKEEHAVFKQLRREVKEIVKHLEPKRRKEILAKAFLFPTGYFLIYATALYWGANPQALYTCYFLLGLMIIFIFLNTIHDAVHGTIFKSKWANRLYIHLFDLMGANSYVWQLRHVRFHHNYPNVQDWDTDLEQSPIIKIFRNSDHSPLHKYQHLYFPFIYPFYLFNWLLVRDFRDFFEKNRTVRRLIDIPRIEYVKLFFFKSLFIFYLIMLPKIFLDISWGQVLTAFLIMTFTASIFSLTVLLTAHPNTENSFPLPDDNNQLPHSWMMHMLLTTNDATHDNFFTRFFMGCFHFHVAHHLFPNVNHVYYPEITARLKEVSKKYGLPYRTFPLTKSLADHYRLLKQNAIEADIFEETM